MLCNKPFEAEKQPGYNAKWGVVYSVQYGEKHVKWPEALNTGFYASLTRDIENKWNNERMTEADKILRDKFMAFLSDKLDCVYPEGHLVCGGSSVSMCGTPSSDMDLCYVIKTSERAQETCYRLPIEKYSEKINAYIVDRMNRALRPFPEITELETVSAKVPIVKFNLNTKEVSNDVEPKDFEFDINCNCVAGIYNANLLGGLATFDERLPKLAIILKEWAKNVRIVDKYGRFNSYLIVLLIVHYLQCGVHPPVLPNLMKLQPKDYDGNNEPWNLTTEVDRSVLPERENNMGVGALLCGFFRYYSKFNFREYGILIKDASIIELAKHGYLDGMLGSMIFVEEPYDGLTVPKNIKKNSDFLHIQYEFQIAEAIMNPVQNGKMCKPQLGPLLERKLPAGIVTREEEVEEILRANQ